MIKINTSGDYVQLIYVDPVQESVQQELKSDTDAFECSYDSEGKLYLQFGLMRFENPDPTDFTVNDVAVTDAADFISKLNALFTGGGGGGSSFLPTTGTGTATGDITGDLNGHSLLITLSGNDFLHLNSPEGCSLFEATDGDIEGHLFIEAVSAGNQRFNLIIEGTDHTVNILGSAGNNILPSSLTYTADTHTFNGVINLPTQAAPASPNDGDIWREDNTDTGLKIRINGVTKTITVS